MHSQHHLIAACTHLQEPRAESAPKRVSCVITGRHPNTPRQVAVVCRQLTGTLVLGDCCQQLKILHNGSEMAPPDFEAAAGCSKGKNWKVSKQRGWSHPAWGQRNASKSTHAAGHIAATGVRWHEELHRNAGMVQIVPGQACMMLCMLALVLWHSMTVLMSADLHTCDCVSTSNCLTASSFPPLSSFECVPSCSHLCTCQHTCAQWLLKLLMPQLCASSRGGWFACTDHLPNVSVNSCSAKPKLWCRQTSKSRAAMVATRC